MILLCVWRRPRTGRDGTVLVGLHGKVADNAWIRRELLVLVAWRPESAGSLFFSLSHLLMKHDRDKRSIQNNAEDAQLSIYP